MSWWKCPKCGRFLQRTETDGLWCKKGCYESEFDLWVVLYYGKENIECQEKKTSSYTEKS